MAIYALLSLVLSILSLCIPHQGTVATGNETDLQSSKHPQLTTLASNTVFKDSEQKFLVCYFYNWSAHRSGRAQFLPEDIDLNLCTHIIYKYAVLNSETLTMVPDSPDIDTEQVFYKHIVSLKKENEKLKVLLSLGGSVDSASDKYSRMVSEPQSRSTFVKEAVAFLKKYKFDGLELNWVSPVCWQNNCSNGDPRDKVNFVRLIKELREAFNELSPPLLLTVALTRLQYIAEKAFDVADLAKYSDFFNVPAYGFHGPWDTTTGHHSEMYGHRDDSSDRNHSTAALMEYYVQQGSPPEKLLMGIPLFGMSFTLKDPNNNNIDAPVTGPGNETIYTNIKGFLAYYEICDRIQHHNWAVRRDPEAGPYAFHGDQWVGYDDPISAKEKASFILQKGYGGATVWELSLDDFTGRCDMGTFPVIRALRVTLQSDNKPKDGGGSEKAAVLVPSIVGAVVTLIIIVTVIVLFYRRKRHLRQVPDSANEGANTPVYYNIGYRRVDLALQNPIRSGSSDDPPEHINSEVRYNAWLDRVQLPPRIPTYKHNTL